MKSRDTEKMRLVMGLWMKHQPTVSAYVASVVRDRHHVEDVVQEVASAVSMQVDQYDADRPFLPWALGIAHNQMLKYLRGRKRERLVFDDELLERLADQHIEHADSAAARKAALHQCLERLSDDRKKLLESRYFKQIAVQQIAEDAGRTPSAISMTLMRIRQQLANCIRKRLTGETGGQA